MRAGELNPLSSEVAEPRLLRATSYHAVPRRPGAAATQAKFFTGDGATSMFPFIRAYALRQIDAATFYHVLERIDAELAETTRRIGCQRCEGVLHKANYPRKPRGGPPNLPASYGSRASYCCAVDGCRARATPPSVRFLARRVYLGAVVVLASALQHGVSAFRVRQLTELFGASRQTLLRWRSWWLEAFPSSRFWLSLRGRLMPAVDETTLPRSLIERFEPGRVDGGALAGLLRVLQPISTRPWLWASAS